MLPFKCLAEHFSSIINNLKLNEHHNQRYCVTSVQKNYQRSEYDFNLYLKFDSVVYFDCIREEEVFLLSELTLKDEIQTRNSHLNNSYRGCIWSVNLLPNLGSLKLCHTLIRDSYKV